MTDAALDHPGLGAGWWAMDADSGTGGDQAFTFIGNAAFSASGQVRAEVVGGMTVVSGNVNADLGADFAVRLSGSHNAQRGQLRPLIGIQVGLAGASPTRHHSVSGIKSYLIDVMIEMGFPAPETICSRYLSLRQFPYEPCSPPDRPPR